MKNKKPLTNRGHFAIFNSLTQSSIAKMRTKVCTAFILLIGLLGCSFESKAGAFTASGSTLTLDLNVASQLVTITSTGSTYTFVLSGGATNTWTGTTSSSLTVSGATLTVTATGLSTFSTFNITDSQTGTAVTFATSGASTYADNFNITLDNTPGAVTFNGTTSFTGSNALSINTSTYINFATLSNVSTVNGDLSLLANTQAVPNDFAFSGIKVDSATVQITGTGILTMKARGGSTGSSTVFNNRGIAIINGAVVKGGTTGTTIIEGKGFTGTTSTTTRAQGVVVYAKQGGTATLSTNGSNISVTGYGANTTSTGTDVMFNCGVMVGDYTGSFSTQTAGTISSGGSGTVSITGYGGTAANPAAGPNGGAATWNSGVCVFGGFSQITSGGGNVSVTGTGGGTDSASAGNHGVNLYYGTITAGTNGNITVTGTGSNIKGTYSLQGGRNCGVFLYGSSTYPGTIQGSAGTGNVLVTGNGGGYQGIGVYIWTGAIIKSLGSGSVTVIGYGSTFSPTLCYGVLVSGNGATTPTVTTGGGNLRVEGYGGGNGVANGTQVTSNYGVAVGTSGVVSAGGLGTTTVIGVGSSNSVGGYNHGVYITSFGSSQNPGYISSSGGNVIVTGTGGNNSNTTNSNIRNYGVSIEMGSYITAGGTGSVTVTGTGGGNSSSNSGAANYGINLDPFSARGSTGVYQTRITSSGGDIIVNGTGGGNGSSGGNNYGISNNGLIKATGAGTVTVNGTGGTSTGGTNAGVYVNGAPTILTVAYPAAITSDSANVSVTGIGGGSSTAGNNYGVQLNAGGVISAGTNGNVSVTGTGGSTSGGSNAGIQITGNTGSNFSSILSNGGNIVVTGSCANSTGSSSIGVNITSSGKITAGGNGTVTVTGTGGASSTSTGNYGVYLSSGTSPNFSMISSSGGNISVTGIAGGTGASSNSNVGIYLYNGAKILGGGNGTVTIIGSGSTNATSATGANHGVWVQGGTSPNFSIITSSGGDVYVYGTGGNGRTNALSNYGNGVYCFVGGTISSGGTGNVRVDGICNDIGIGVNVNGTITSGGSGTVTIDGRGGTFASLGTTQHGVLVSGTGYKITSGGGNINIVGTEGSSTSSFAVSLADNGSISTATNGGDITLRGNSFNASAGCVVSAGTANSLTLKQLNNGTTVNIGTNNSDIRGSLYLSGTEMGLLTANQIYIGDAYTGAITISAGVTCNNNIKLSGASVSAPATGTDIFMTGKNLTFANGTPINIAINSPTSFETLVVDGNVDLTGTNLVLNGSYTTKGNQSYPVVSVTNLANGFAAIPDSSIITYKGRSLVAYYSPGGGSFPYSIILVDLGAYVSSSPSNATFTEGATASFTVAGSASGGIYTSEIVDPTVQWQVSTNNGTTWTNVSGGTNLTWTTVSGYGDAQGQATYSFTTTLADNGKKFRAIYTNNFGSDTTTAALLTVYALPVITSQPSNQSVTELTTVTFTAAASGTPTPTCQWQESTDGGSNWNDVSGATSATYSFTTSLSQNGNQYHAVFTNAAGSVTTNAATLTVTPACQTTTSSETATACDSYTWKGNTYTSSGAYTYTTTNAAGCDSIVTLNLTINVTGSDTTTVSACDSYTWSANSTAYTQSGTYTSLNGCTTHILNLTINTSNSDTVTITECNSYTWTTNSTTYTTSGTYTSIDGCTTHVLNLTINSSGNTPTTACYQTATFNSGTCTWDITGTQPSTPTGLSCYQTATFNNTTCSWDVTGSQPTIPSLACYETASFNSSTCVWDITGTQPAMPTLACYETASFNTTSCAWVVTGTQPSMPTLACYETANFNTTSCAWVVTGSQPTIPTLTCYESASFNTTSCAWDVTGIQPSAPTGLACYETATFNNSTCSWDITGSAAAAIVTNTTSCGAYTWGANGQTYTQSGTYTYYANCQDYTLILSAAPSTTYFADLDGDGYGNSNSTTASCNGTPAGYTTQGGDCNDTSATAYPGAVEICNNGIDDNCDGVTDEGTSVTANPISGNLSICNMYAGAKTLTTTPIPGINTYNWTVPSDMTITSGQGTTSITVYWSNIYLLANGIIGDVTVTAMGSTTGCGTLIPAKLPVDLNYAAPVTPPSISGPGAICPNQSGIYSIALVKRATSYDWSVPTGATINSGNGSNIINVSYANGFAGGNLTVGARNVCGLSTPLRSRTVTLNTLPAPSSITGPVDGLCNASNANYLATAVAGATGYNWIVPATGSINGGSTSNNISVNFNSSFASGNITVAAVNNCGAGATRSLSLRAAPATPGIITGPASACAGSTQSYGITTVQGASNYIWTVPGGAIINSGQGTKNLNVNHSTNASTTGIITVRASNGCGTSAARVLAVVTSICPRLGDATTQLEVYPNPANSFINLSFNIEQSQQVTIILRDAAGRIVYNEVIDAIAGFNNQQIEVSNLAKGVYFVQLQTGDSSENTRLIIE